MARKKKASKKVSRAKETNSLTVDELVKELKKNGLSLTVQDIITGKNPRFYIQMEVTQEVFQTEYPKPGETVKNWKKLVIGDLSPEYKSEEECQKAKLKMLASTANKMREFTISSFGEFGELVEKEMNI